MNIVCKKLDKEGTPIIVHYITIGNDSTDAFYLVSIEAPESSWEERLAGGFRHRIFRNGRACRLHTHQAMRSCSIHSKYADHSTKASILARIGLEQQVRIFTRKLSKQRLNR